MYSFVEVPLGCFEFLARMTKATMNIEQVSLWYDEVPFGYMPKFGVAGS